MFLGIPENDIGQIGGGKRKLTGKLDVGDDSEPDRRGQVEECVTSYGQVIVDECHHIPAVSFERVHQEVPMLMRMFEKRLRTYRAIGYARGTSLGLQEPQEERVLEYGQGMVGKHGSSV